MFQRIRDCKANLNVLQKNHFKSSVFKCSEPTYLNVLEYMHIVLEMNRDHNNYSYLMYYMCC